MKVTSLFLTVLMIASAQIVSAQTKKKSATAAPAVKKTDAAPAPAAAPKPKRKSLHDEFTGQGYGTSGCGLGSIVFGDKPGMIQIFAATTNASGFQTIAISSGTSNCGEDNKPQQALQFIEMNKMALENDIVRGQGEALSALSQVLECKNVRFDGDLKENYRRHFPNGGASSLDIRGIADQVCKI